MLWQFLKFRVITIYMKLQACMYGGTTDTKHHRKGPLGRFSSINTRNIYLHDYSNNSNIIFNVTILDVICSW